MTNKEVVQALRYCKFGVSCENCPAVGNEDCFDEVNTAAADLIERLTAENAALREKKRWISVTDPPRKRRARRMDENRVCFTVRGEFGAQMSFESKNTIPYEDLCKCINKDTLVELMCLDSLGYTGDDIQFITPEEYDERFGGDKDA